MKYIILIVAAALLAGMIVHKIKHGSASCCGEKEAAEEKIVASDKDLSHYPFQYVLSIDGMVCINCIRRVENLFNATGEMIAKASLEKKGAQLFSMHELERKDVASMLAEAGYTLTEFDREKNEEGKNT